MDPDEWLSILIPLLASILLFIFIVLSTSDYLVGLEQGNYANIVKEEVRKLL